MSHVIGIDPGKSGGIAVIEDGVLTEVYSMPLLPCKHKSRRSGQAGPCSKCRKLINEPMLLDLLLLHGNPLAVVLERQMTRSHQKGQFTIADHHGFIRGLATGMGWTLDNPRPQRWQEEAWLHLSERDQDHEQLGTKKKSIRAAGILYPYFDFTPEGCRTEHDGWTDAALIARYGWRKYGR